MLLVVILVQPNACGLDPAPTNPPIWIRMQLTFAKTYTHRTNSTARTHARQTQQEYKNVLILIRTPGPEIGWKWKRRHQNKRGHGHGQQFGTIKFRGHAATKIGRCFNSIV